MSNHSGSYLLNEVLSALEKRKIFDFLGKEATQDTVLEIIRIARRYDCNPGEILDAIGTRVGVCYYCLTPQSRFCRERFAVNVTHRGKKPKAVEILCFPLSKRRRNSPAETLLRAAPS